MNKTIMYAVAAGFIGGLLGSWAYSAYQTNKLKSAAAKSAATGSVQAPPQNKLAPTK